MRTIKEYINEAIVKHNIKNDTSNISDEEFEQKLKEAYEKKC